MIDINTFIIGELSANHNGSIETAKQTIKAIAETGADAVKLQTYTPNTITLDCDNEFFKINNGSIWDGKTLYELYQEAYTPWEWHKELFDYANSLDLVCFSSPFDPTAVDFLEELNTPIYKIASFEITDIPLIEYAASKGKPMIISTGIATELDIKDAVEACRRVGNDDITLLYCISSYPARPEEFNLRTMVDIKERYGVKVGLSDHSLSNEISISAVAMGAKVLEKHIILDRNMGGPDSSFSLEPHEFTDMVKSIRVVEKAMGEVDYSLTEKKKANRVFSRSLFVVEDIKEGEGFTHKNIRSIRPSNGLPPKCLKDIIGKKANRTLIKGTPLSKEDIFDE
ncbi:MAG: pseudaminic acid synthase [Candidatus Muiribacterium halophilum]|uniref:Pseudaminic acid synthase n=1 Tax=Muiribacterium halophilum TaxID=2053465 RepID=A0A2N5Z9S8_MUIH1|nr:MAG: pseudaminic acid synthase [Candidatus Muirbacterium halophilum]